MTAEGHNEQTPDTGQYRAIVESISEAAYFVDSDQNLAYTNQSSLQHPAVSLEVLRGGHVMELIEQIAADDEDPERFEQALERVYDESTETEYPITVELDIDRPTGTVTRAYRCSPCVTESGTGAIVVSGPGTDRSEPELERYEQLFETLPVAVGVNSLGESGQFEFVNQTAVEMFGADSKAELKEYSPGDLYANPDERAQFADRLREERAIEQYETEFTTLDGDNLWVNITAELTTIDGEQRIVGIVEDISERKQQERELREKRERLRGLFDEAPDPMFVQDEKGRFTDVNQKAAEKLGYSREELLEMEAADLDAAVDRDKVSELLAMVKSDSQTIEIEGRHQSADGSTYPVDVRVTPLETDGRDRFLSHARDITERKEREQELERKQVFLEQTQEVATVGGWEVDLRTDSLRWTEEVYRIHGVDSDFEPTVEGAIDLYHPDDQAMIQEAVGKATTAGEPYDKEVRIVRPDGEIRWTRARGEPRYEESEIVGVRGTFQDITERKEREQELERHRNVVQAVDDGVYALDETGHFELVNDAMSELTGYDTEELLGEHTSYIKSDAVVERAESVVRSMILDEREDDEVTIELNIQRADGGEFPAEDHMSLLRDDDGERFEGTAGVIRDITERKEREQELERKQEFLEQTQEVAAVGGWEVDLRTDSLRWTEEVYRIHGVDSDFEPTVEGAIDLYHPEDQAMIQEAVGKATTAGEPYDKEVRIVRPDGEIRWTRARGEPRYEDGEIIGARGTFQDITERREREDQLRKSNERLEQFAYVASHDLQEPLRTISNYTEILEEDYVEDLDEEAQRFIDVVVTGSERMQSMINGLLDYSRVTTRGGEFEPVDTEQVVADTVADLEVILDEHDGRVEASELPTVEADGDQLHQVFQNLVKNALEHSGEDPATIEIRASEEPNQYRFEVEDDGPGIAESRQEKIFRIFKSGEQYQTQSQAKGLGLAICDNIVRRHGGDIWVESDPGEGATFTFTINKDKDSAKTVTNKQ